MINNPAEKTSREQAKHDTELTKKQGYSPAQIKLTENKLKQKRRETWEDFICFLKLTSLSLKIL